MPTAKKSLFKSSSGSDTDCFKVCVPQNASKNRAGRSSVAPETSVAALLQAFRPCFGLYSCRSNDLVRVSRFDASATDLDGAVQPVFSGPPYSFQQLRHLKSSAHGRISFGDMMTTVEFIMNLL